MMNPLSRPGTKIRFHGYGGTPEQRNIAHDILEVGKVYTVKRMRVEPQISYAVLEEVDGEFNSVFFENVEIW